MFSKSKKLFYIGVVVLTAISLVWLYRSNYPPTFEQIRFFSGPLIVSLSRLISVILIVFSIKYFLKQFKVEEKKMLVFYFLLSPIFFVILTMYPLETLKLCSVILLVSFFANQSSLKKIGSIFLVSIWILFITLYCEHQTPHLLTLLSPKTAQETVNERFRKESVLTPNNYLPHSLKRLGYNKYFLLLKPIGEEVIGFGDLESIFFQEIHPLDQKSTPILFWPQAILFALALYFQVSKKNSRISGFYYLLTIGVIYYLFSAGGAGLRLAFVGFSIIYLLSVSTTDFGKKPFNLIFSICILLSLWGALAHISDRWVRPDYWLDNKPLIYKYGFTDSILTGNSLPVYFSDHFGVGQKYCSYYRKDCSRFHFSDSTQNLFGSTPGIFIGFTGDYFGPRYDNFEKEAINLDLLLKEKGVGNYNVQKIRDNILNQFGLNLIIAKVDTNEN